MRLISYVLALSMVICGSVNAQTTISGVNPLSGVRTGFFPDSIPGLKFWGDGSRGVTIDSTAGVDTVSQWSDQSGSGNHATQVVKANQPTLLKDVVHGHSALRFPGPPVYMSANALAAFFTGDDIPNTVFVVCRTTTPGTGFVYCVGNSGSSTPIIRLNPCSAALNVNYTRTDDTAVTGNSLITDASSFANVWFIYSARQTGGPGNVMRNNVTGVGSVNVGPITLDTFAIGAHDNGTISNTYRGDIAELIVYNRSLTDVERERITAYLNQKYVVF